MGLLKKLNCDDFFSVAEYLGIAEKDWMTGIHRNDTICRHCLVNGSSGFIRLNANGSVDGHIQTPSFPDNLYLAIVSGQVALLRWKDVRRKLTAPGWIPITAWNCHKVCPRCPWCRDDLCDCSELREGIYDKNAGYYDARFLTFSRAAQATGIKVRTLRWWRETGKLNAGNGLVGKRILDMEKFVRPSVRRRARAHGVAAA